MQEFKRVYNAAKAAAAAEEEQTMFSLGQRELPVVRSLTGDVHSKEVVVAIVLKSGQTKNFKLIMKQYLLKDESNNLPHRGRWVIIKFEPLS